jgi:UDP-3-O-[3-hydroxymyristoyl] glucosamine N-acyltransferase
MHQRAGTIAGPANPPSFSKEAALMGEQPSTLGQLAELVGGTLRGDPATPIEGAAVLGEAVAGQITLVDHPDRVKQLATTSPAAVVVPEKISCDWPAAVIVADVHAAFIKIVEHFRPPRPKRNVGVSPRAIVSSTAWIGSNVNIHPGATVDDDCEIGDETTILPGAHLLPGCLIGREVTIGPGAVLYEDTIVGDRSIIHAGVVLGCHGFGYSQAGGRHVPAAQLGHVRIGSDVEIGAGTTIDRGTYGGTTIGDGTKIDNLVQIAHNCRIGRHNLICSQVGIAGSTSTGDYVVMGGQAGIRDHVHIGTGAMLSAMAGITNDVPDGAVMMGIPATPDREQKLKQAALAKLPEMRKEFKTLRATVAELEKAVARGEKSDGKSERAA